MGTSRLSGCAVSTPHLRRAYVTHLKLWKYVKCARYTRFTIGALLLIMLSTSFIGCKESNPSVERPKVGPMPQAKRDSLNSNFAQAQQRLYKRSTGGAEPELLAL